MSAKTGAGFDRLMEVLDGEGSGAVTPDLDYDIYAEGEAELGWYNGTADVAAADAFGLDALLTDVIGRMKGALAAEDYEAAHLKAVGVADGGFGVANLVSSDGRATLSAASDRTVPAGGAAELILNARVAGDPEVLKGLVHAAVHAAGEAVGASVALRDERAFRPGRPVPTHRMTDGAKTPAGGATVTA